MQREHLGKVSKWWWHLWLDRWIETFRPIIKIENCEISRNPKVWNIVRFDRADPSGEKPVYNIIVNNLCSLCSNSWQSLQVSVSQVSQKSFSGSCLWMGQKTGRCPDAPTDSRHKRKVCLVVEEKHCSGKLIVLTKNRDCYATKLAMSGWSFRIYSI